MSVVVFSAHALDYLWRTSGTIARYAKSGEDVHIICLTYGERGESNSFWKGDREKVVVEQIKEIRRQESEAVAKALGATIEFLDFGDGPLVMTQERNLEMIRALRRVKPSIVITHPPISHTNPDHTDTAHYSLRAIRYACALGVDIDTEPMKRPQVYFFEQMHPEYDEFKAQIYVDITDVIDIRLEAMKLVTTQASQCETYTRKAQHRAAMARDLFGSTEIQYAEVFQKHTAFIGKFLP